MATQPASSSGKPHVLFQGSFELGGGINDYDLTPDAHAVRFLRLQLKAAPN